MRMARDISLLILLSGALVGCNRSPDKGPETKWQIPTSGAADVTLNVGLA